MKDCRGKLTVQDTRIPELTKFSDWDREGVSRVCVRCDKSDETNKGGW